MSEQNLKPLPERMTATKAWAAGAAGTAVAFLTSLHQALDDSVVTGQEWTSVALATVIGGAAAFGITWAAPPNRVK